MKSMGSNRVSFPTQHSSSGRNIPPAGRVGNVAGAKDGVYGTIHDGSMMASTEQSGKYGYKAPLTPQHSFPSLTDTQMTPQAFQRGRQTYDTEPHTSSASHHQEDFTTHGRPRSRFKPAKLLPNSAMSAADSSRSQGISSHEAARRTRPMGPPPTPQRFRQQESLTTYSKANNVEGSANRSTNFPVIATNRFLPSAGNEYAVNTQMSKNRDFPHLATPLNAKAQQGLNGTQTRDISVHRSRC
ncbi:hypothetical protein AX17_002880 [Amanita inopinata Kibby_2008]|nr:hypothetical protein AX17_002880 [Amanita inopinata Kibby_2008]